MGGNGIIIIACWCCSKRACCCSCVMLFDSVGVKCWDPGPMTGIMGGLYINGGMFAMCMGMNPIGQNGICSKLLGCACIMCPAGASSSNDIEVSWSALGERERGELRCESSVTML